MDSFKEFVRKNPILINYVKNNEMTWQKFYEIYSLYGEDEEAWKDYLDKDKKEVKEKAKGPTTIQDFLEMAKNMDVKKVQDGITSLQKAIGLFGDLFVNSDNNTQSTYQPRPLYRSFED